MTISELNPAIALLTTIIVATPSITLMMLASAMCACGGHESQVS